MPKIVGLTMEQKSKHRMETLLDFIGAKRRRLKISQAEMGRQLNISQCAYSNKETGKDRISAEELIVIFHVLGCTEEEKAKYLTL